MKDLVTTHGSEFFLFLLKFTFLATHNVSCRIIALSHQNIATILFAGAFRGSNEGEISKYFIGASLEKALTIYGAGKGGERPVKDKQKLVEELRKAVAEATAYCTRHQVTLEEIEKLGGMERLQAIEDAVNSLISPDACAA